MTVAPMRALATAWLGVLALGCVDANLPARPTVSDADGGVDGGASPLALASTTGCVLDLALSGDTLFWTERATGRVMSVPTAGGTPTVIAVGQVDLGPIAAEPNAVYWVADKAILKKVVPKGQDPTTIVAATADDVNGLLIVAGVLYFGRGTSAFSTSTNGGALLELGRSPEGGKPAALALDQTHLYQTELDHVAVTRERLDGKQAGYDMVDAAEVTVPLAPDRIAVSQGGLVTDSIGVVAGKVIWANDDALYAKSVDFNELDSNFSFTSTTTGSSITGFVVSGDEVFFGVENDDVVLRAPIPTGGDSVAPTVFARNQPGARQLVADDTYVYWRTDACRIMRLAK